MSITSMSLAQLNWLLSYIPEVALPRKKAPIGTTPGATIRSSVTEGMYQMVRLAGLSGAVAVTVGAYGAHEMEQDDDEPDEDEEFLRAAEKIVDDFRKGIDVSHLVRRLKRPAHSYDEDATGGIYEVLEMIASLDKSTRSPSASPPPASSPMPTDERSNFNINQLNGSTKKRLCFSPTSQVGECGNNLINETPFVPKLQLDFSLPSSVQHSPQASPVFFPSNAVGYSPTLRPRSRQCRSREGSLNASDFVYLIIVGFISSLIVYYIYMPRLHKGPVY